MKIYKILSKLNTSNLNLLGKNILYIASIIFFFLYSIEVSFTLLVFITCLITVGDLMILFFSNFLRNRDVIDSGHSCSVQALKAWCIFYYIWMGTQHPSAMLLANTIPKENEFSREQASKFLSYRFLSDEQKKSFYSYVDKRITVIVSNIKMIKEEISSLEIYKRSMQNIVDKELGDYIEGNKLLLNDINRELYFKTIDLKILEEELAKLKESNE